MARIILTKRADELAFDGDAFAVVAPGMPTPKVPRIESLEALLAQPQRLDEGGTMVVVGLSRMMTPANRVKLGRVFLRPRAGLRRIVVDDVLFVSEPWRMWWAFRAVDADAAFGFTDSFQAETRWKAAHEMRTEDPFDSARVLPALRDIARAVDPFKFAPIDVVVQPVSSDVLEAYAREKEDAFTHEKSLAPIVRRLAAVAQSAVPERSVPTTASLWKRPPTRIVRTDLPVDDYLVGELLRRVELTNAIAEVSA